MRGLQRVDAELRHAEIGGLADHLDVAEKEAHVRDVQIKHGGLDVDRHVGFWRFATANDVGEGPRARADARSWLAALLVADEGEQKSRVQRNAGAIERADRFDCRAEPGLEIAGSSTPDGAVDEGAPERVFALRAGPALPTAPDVRRVGMSDHQHSVGAAPAPAHAPDVRPARGELAGDDVLGADRNELVLQQGGEGGLIAGDARRGDRFAKQGERLALIESRPEARNGGAITIHDGVPIGGV